MLKSDDDFIKLEQWDTCNCVIILWMMNIVGNDIFKFIFYMNTVLEIWKYLE